MENKFGQWMRQLFAKLFEVFAPEPRHEWSPVPVHDPRPGITLHIGRGYNKDRNK